MNPVNIADIVYALRRRPDRQDSMDSMERSETTRNVSVMVKRMAGGGLGNGKKPWEAPNELARREEGCGKSGSAS